MTSKKKIKRCCCSEINYIRPLIMSKQPNFFFFFTYPAKQLYAFPMRLHLVSNGRSGERGKHPKYDGRTGDE